MKLTYWHRFAYMYLEHELDIDEIVKVWIINTYARIVEDDTKKLIGINVLDNSGLNEALILGLLRAFTPQKSIRYEEIAEIISKHYNTVLHTTQRLLKKGYVSKVDNYRNGAFYTVVKDDHLPLWMIEFTQAIVDIRTNDELKKKVYDECKGINFRRGMEILKDEILAKFRLPPRKAE